MQDIPRELVYEPILNRFGKGAVIAGVLGVAFGYTAGYREIELTGGVLSVLGIILLILRRRFDRYDGPGQDRFDR